MATRGAPDLHQPAEAAPPIATGRAIRGLLVRSAMRLAVLPVADVVETMRPLGVAAVGGAPSYVLGIAIVRGAPAPVLDLGALLSGTAGQDARWVTLRLGERRVVLSVDKVVGVCAIDSGKVASLPRLVEGARAEAITSVGALDRDLLLVLDATRLVPPELWTLADAQGEAS